MKIFNFKTTEEKLNSGKMLVQKNGGKFYTNGTFEVSGVEGKISYEKGIVTITITDKPWLASWDMIGDKLNEYFN